jgi:hypothetical protein
MIMPTGNASDRFVMFRIMFPAAGLVSIAPGSRPFRGPSVAATPGTAIPEKRDGDVIVV